MLEIQPVDPEFVRVWSRVKAPVAPVKAEEQKSPQRQEGWEEFLTGKIRAELQRARDYRSLGLEAAARESMARAKKLSAAWFFRSGERYLPLNWGRANRYPGPGAAIRQLYLGEQLSEQDYLRARDTCGDDTLRQVFNFCARGCQKVRQALWNAVEQGGR